MTTAFALLIFSVLLAFLLTFPVYWRERRLLRLAKAKLEIAKAVTAMEELMLSGKLHLGEACHDVLFKAMSAAESSDNYSFSWRFWSSPSQEERQFRKSIREEVESKGSDVSGPLGGFIYAYIRAFSSRRPFVSKVFVLWVLCFGMGAFAVLTAITKYKSLKTGYQSFRRLTAEWLVTRICV